MEAARRSGPHLVTLGIPGHVFTSAAGGVVAFAVTASFPFALGVAFGNLLLDGDHLLDYYLIDRQQSFSPARFFRFYENYFPPRRVLLFHSYELVALTMLLGFLTGMSGLIGLGVGAAIHVASDIVPRSNRSLWSRIRMYSLIYRWRHNFSSCWLYR